MVATHPVQFLDEHEFQAHEARVCIAEGEILNPPRAPLHQDQYLLSSEEMHRRYADVPSALANTVEIAKRCNLSLVLGKPRLPNFPRPMACRWTTTWCSCPSRAWKSAWPSCSRTRPCASPSASSYERLRWECKTIIQMGFPGYFLIVQDFINWGKNNGVPVGPGRARAPARWWPTRWASPTWTRVRDAGRVLDMPYMFCDGLSKLIPFNPMDPWSLERTLRTSRPSTRWILGRWSALRTSRPSRNATSRKRCADWWTWPSRSRPDPQHRHTPAACSPAGKLTSARCIASPAGNSAVSQFDKDDVEAAGLVSSTSWACAT